MRISDWSSDLCSSDLSGSLTHNLFEFRHSLNDPEYAQTFADWIAAAVIRGDVQSLLQYRERAPHAVRAHPTEEHFLPLLVALGASVAGEPRRRVEGGIDRKSTRLNSSH